MSFGSVSEIAIAANPRDPEPDKPAIVVEEGSYARQQVVALGRDLEVRGNTPAGAVCAIKATDSYAVDVGYREVRISDLPTTTTVTIPTVIRAGSVTVLGCAAGDEDLQVPPPDFPPGVAIP